MQFLVYLKKVTKSFAMTNIRHKPKADKEIPMDRSDSFENEFERDNEKEREKEQRRAEKAMRKENERLEYERREYERTENERIENERIENERIENERRENERRENERRERKLELNKLKGDLGDITAENDIYKKFPQIKGHAQKRLSYKDLELLILDERRLSHASENQLIMTIQPFSDKNFVEFYDELHSFRIRYYNRDFSAIAEAPASIINNLKSKSAALVEKGKVNKYIQEVDIIEKNMELRTFT